MGVQWEEGPVISKAKNAKGPWRRSLTQHHHGGPQAQTRGSTTSRLYGGCNLPDEGLPLSSPVEAPLETRPPNVMVGPIVATMYATRIVQDEATGAMYMDTVTSLVGRVALRNPCMAANLQSPQWRTSLMSFTEQRQLAIL